jgi:RNA polymerase sigma-70 factor (ECF subfamily)
MSTPRPPDLSSDLDLLAGWRAGERSMGSALYRRYANPIAAFFRRNIHDRAHVEDLTQDTFLALRESTADIEHVSGYLFQIAFFKFTRYLRKRRGLPELGDEGDDLDQIAADTIPDPEFFTEQRMETRLLLRAIRRLALIHQQVLELHFWADKSGPEIAEILRIPEGTVRSRLRLAQQKLDEKLKALADTAEALRATTTSIETWRARLQAELADPPAEEFRLRQAKRAR